MRLPTLSASDMLSVTAMVSAIVRAAAVSATGMTLAMGAVVVRATNVGIVDKLAGQISGNSIIRIS